MLSKTIYILIIFLFFSVPLNAQNTVTVSGTSSSPASAYQSVTNLAMIKLNLKSNPGNSILLQLGINRTGTPGTQGDNDILAVKLVKYDSGSSFTINVGATSLPATEVSFPALFQNGTATLYTINPGGETITAAGQDYYITYDINPGAKVGDLVGVTISANADITLDTSNLVAPANFGMASGLMTILNYPNNITTAIVGINPSQVCPGEKVVGFVKLGLTTNVSTSTLSELDITRYGASSDSDVGVVKLYKDTNYSGTFEPGQDTLIASANFASGVASLMLTQTAEVITQIPWYYFVVYDISQTATINDTLGLQIASTSAFHFLEAGNVVTNSSIFPWNSNSLSIITVSTPVPTPSCVSVSNKFCIQNNIINIQSQGQGSGTRQANILYSVEYPVDLVSIQIFDKAGKLAKTLVNKYMNPGQNSISWDGTNNGGSLVTPGVYIVVVKMHDFVEKRKIVVVR